MLENVFTMICGPFHKGAYESFSLYEFVKPMSN